MQRTPSNTSHERRHICNDKGIQRRRAKRHTIQLGDSVLVKDCHPGSKFHLPFEPNPWTVTGVRGTIITATRNGESVTRNVSFKWCCPNKDTNVAIASPRRSATVGVGLPIDASLSESPSLIRPTSTGPELQSSPVQIPVNQEALPSADSPGASQRSLATRYHLQDIPAPS